MSPLLLRGIELENRQCASAWVWGRPAEILRVATLSFLSLCEQVSNQCEAWCSSIGLSSGESAKLEFNEPAGLSVMHLGSHLLLKDLSSDGMAPNVYESGTSQLSRASEELGPHCASPILSAANLAVCANIRLPLF